MPEGQINTLEQAQLSFNARIGEMRESTKAIEVAVRKLKEETGPMTWPDTYKGQRGEMIAQSMLAVRALEDARLRLGKVLQYAGDGVSIYDKA